MFNKLLRRARKNQKGFTLVELMVVVVIIGILTAIAMPVYNNVTEKAQVSACKANMRIIDGAVMMWQMDQDPPTTNVPDDLDDLADYFQSTPVCPVEGATYTLSATGTTCSEATHN